VVVVVVVVVGASGFTAFQEEAALWLFNVLKDPSNLVVNLEFHGEHITIRPPKGGGACFHTHFYSLQS
jgi:hypothetical protein